jgi:hypothetical protein
MFQKILNWFSIPRSNDDDLLGDAKTEWMTGKLNLDFDHGKFNKKNIFNNLSKTSDYGFYYWPYGYLFRHFKWGNVNELGFRCKDDFYNINEKFKSHYKIGFFGGSTGFDVTVKDEDTIVNQLENKLNNNQELVKKFGNFKIINFSQPGNLVINQILNFIQFGSIIDLKLVISHSFCNDVGTGIINDPKILKNYKLGYVDICEPWARKIHESRDVEIDLMFMNPKNQNFKKVELKTDYATVNEAYTFRLNQFFKICDGQDIKFINGIMPFIFSKKKNSNAELDMIKNYNPYYSNVYKVMPIIYENFFEKHFQKISKINTVNHHKNFSGLQDDDTHFDDVVHLNKNGNELVSEMYYQKILNII